MHLLSGFGDQSTVITSAHYSSTGLILTPMGISIGLIFLFSKQATPEEMKAASKRRVKWAGGYLAFVLASLITALLAPITQYASYYRIGVTRPQTLGAACVHQCDLKAEPISWSTRSCKGG